jgi:hypothetical protein
VINKELASLSLADLEDLRANAVEESRTLEYKSQLNWGPREERIELLADITAFANTAGDDLLFGVTEDRGEPTAFPGIEIEDWDALERNISSLIRDGTQLRRTASPRERECGVVRGDRASATKLQPTTPRHPRGPRALLREGFNTEVQTGRGGTSASVYVGSRGF